MSAITDSELLLVEKDGGVLTLTNPAVLRCGRTQDQIEGMRAFLEKRRPVFTGE